MQHDADQAVRFLRYLRPDGYWTLTAIAPDQQGIETVSLDAGDEDGVRRFLSKYPDRNVYYALNPTVRKIDKKMRKVDVARVEWLHVDLDPRVPDERERADLEGHNTRERARIRAKLQSPPAPTAQPHVCVDSGGGYQGLWRLLDPIQITGETDADREASCEEAERYSLALEWALGGDHCHNADRILRLPGTVNHPDEKKRAKGRVRAMAKVEWIVDDAALPLASFTSATRVQPRAAARGTLSGGRSRAAVASAATVTGNVERYTIEQLSTMLPQLKRTAKVVIVQGFDPDQPNKREGRRSEWLFYACCELVRSGASDDVIYSVITDPDFGIAASVLDKGSTRERYAWRQIDQAKEEAINPALRELNERHAVIGNLGGECLVIEEVEDPNLKRTMLTTQSFTAIRNRYMTRKIDLGQDRKGNPIAVPLGVWWLEHPMRRQYDRIVFSPSIEIPGAYNLWQGFAVEARPGDADASFLAHVRDNIANGDPVIYEYLLRWMAKAVQEPSTPGQVAIVLRGGEGTGKGTFATLFGALFGRHFLQVTNAHHLVGNFNSMLADTVVVFADEAFFAGDKRHESVLKAMVTEMRHVIERKGVDAEQHANMLHMIMASNSRWVVPVGDNGRRYCVLDVSPNVMQDTAYFAQIRADMTGRENEGLSNLLYRLIHMDLSDFNVYAFPRTAALRDQKIQSMDSVDEWLFGKLEDGTLLPEHVGWTAPVLKHDLVDDYLMYAQRVGNRRSTATMVGMRLTELFGEKLRRFKGSVERFRDGKRQVAREHFYEFPSLEWCRERFERSGFGEYPWPNVEDRTHITVLAEEGDRTSDVPF
jgi:hypothetical protein